MNSETLNLSTLAKYFSDEAEAWQLMESLRWPDGPVCPHCDHDGKSYYLGNRKTRSGDVSPRRVWKCGKCRKQYSVLVGTIFERSHISLSKWLLGIHLMCAGKNGVSAHELSRQLGVSLKSAWFMAHRIRYAMERPPLTRRLEGMVEADETYLGGRRKKKFGRPGLDSPKTAVVTLVERDGEARSEAVERVSGANLGRMLEDNVDPDAVLISDEWTSYREPGRRFAGHATVRHSTGEYVRYEAGRVVHTNTVEGFFSQLKRSIDGTHHHVSKRHLPRYLAEFDFRYSTRDVTDGERTVQTVKAAEGKRLMYEDAAANR